jgi:hypothetical protein
MSASLSVARAFLIGAKSTDRSPSSTQGRSKTPMTPW